MLEELQEVLGLVAAASVSATVALGAAAYRYQRVKGFLPLKRPTLVRWHLWLGLGFAGALAFHYLLAPRIHALQQVGALALLLALLLGLSFRLGRKHFRAAIQAKIALVVLAGLFLPIGHWLVGGSGSEHEARGARRGSAVAVTGQPAGFSGDGLSLTPAASFR